MIGAITAGLDGPPNVSLLPQCPMAHCPASLQSSVNSYQTLSLVSSSSLIIGGALAVTGLIVVSSRRKTEPPAVAPVVGLGYAGLAGRFSMNGSTESILFGVVACASACSHMFTDFIVDPRISDGGATTTTTSSSSSSTSTGTGGAVTTSGTGGAGCDAGTTACNTVCTDMQTDAHNCGRCAHDCVGGACLAGVCQPWQLVADADIAGSAMDADGAYVVWINSVGNVRQVKIADGTSSRSRNKP